MAYRLRYTFNVDWVPPGTGSVQPNAQTSQNGASGGAQTKGFINTPGGQNVVGTGSGGILAGADVTTLTAAAAVDMAAQINAAIAQLDGFVSGGG